MSAEPTVPTLTVVRTPAEEYEDLQKRLAAAEQEEAAASAALDNLYPAYQAAKQRHNGAATLAYGLRKAVAALTESRPVHRSTVAAVLRKAGYTLIPRSAWTHGAGFSVGQSSYAAEVTYVFSTEMRHQVNRPHRDTPEGAAAAEAAGREIDRLRAEAYAAWRLVLEAEGWVVKEHRRGGHLYVTHPPRYAPPAGGSSSST